MTTTQNEVRCSVCRNPNVAEIDRLMRAGSSVRALAERFADVSKSALARHSEHLVTRLEWPDFNEMAKDAEAIVARGGYEMLAAATIDALAREHARDPVSLPSYPSVAAEVADNWATVAATEAPTAKSKRAR